MPYNRVIQSGYRIKTEFSFMDDTFNRIKQGDCIAAMNGLPAGTADLVFADPPFNIGYDYDVYDDAVEHQQYIDWSTEWISAVFQVLKADGTFWLAIGDDYAAELKLASQKVGFHCRSWVIWYYTFGVNCKHKFTRSHTHLFHFIKDRENFTFRDKDLDNRVPSARELVYNDKRANSQGRLPDDTWITRPADAAGELVGDDIASWSPALLTPPSDTDRSYTLRPQDLDQSFQPSENTWYFPRVAGTFKERAGFHGCQMPEQLLGRIVRTCSNPGEVVLDPFSGSATTLAVAKKLGRRFIGFDLSKAYVRYGQERLKGVRMGDRLDGSPEPMKSAPRTTPAKKKRGRAPKTAAVSSTQHTRQLQEEQYSDIQLNMTLQGIAQAFASTHDGFSADRVVADPDLNREFVAACRNLGLIGDIRMWNTLLFRLRKTGQLSHIRTRHQTSIPWEKCDKYMFASEIAWQMMLDDKSGASLDEILCDPDLAAKFDKTARRFAPGYKSLDYRWAALKIRKEAKVARTRAAVLTAPSRLGKMVPIDELNRQALRREPGLYVISERKHKLYVGETLDLSARFTAKRCRVWSTLFGDAVSVQTLTMNPESVGRLTWQSCLVKGFKQRPLLNCFELRSAS
jgi:DNA modification methylase